MRTFPAAAAVLLAAIGLPASAAEPSSPPVLQAPASEPASPAPMQVNWISHPSPDDFANAYPNQALRQELNGRVRVSCTVGKEGWLEACTVLEADPAGVGFEQASLRMTRRFRLPLTTPDGKPTAGWVVTPTLRWRLPQ